MSKRRSRARKPAAQVVSPESERLNLRTAPPVRRVMGKIAVAVASLLKDHEKLVVWGENNELAKEAAKQLTAILNKFPALTDTLTALDESGFSPPRLSYTASAAEGDCVSVLEKHRYLYEEIMPHDEMVSMIVVKKHPGKGGGLVVVSTAGNRMKVAMAHVVKM